MGRGVTRRDAFSGLGVGVVGSLAGCHEAAVPDDESVAGDWPTFGYDAANTGVSPDSPGPSDPAERWRFTLDREATASPAVVGDTVYVDTLGGHTYALGAATGERRWLARASFPLFGTPAVDDGTVYVTDGRGIPARAGRGRLGGGSGGDAPARRRVPLAGQGPRGVHRVADGRRRQRLSRHLRGRPPRVRRVRRDGALAHRRRPRHHRRPRRRGWDRLPRHARPRTPGRRRPRRHHAVDGADGRERPRVAGGGRRVGLRRHRGGRGARVRGVTVRRPIDRRSPRTALAP